MLFERKLEAPEEGEDKGKAVGDSSMTKHIKERLADTHDLLAEISLENERFPDAVRDFRSALSYKEALYPLESEIIAEAYFKLSLALEFSSITTTQEEGNDATVAKETQVDEDMREEAAKMLEKAIESTKIKLQNQEVELATVKSVDDNDVTIKRIADVKEIVADMEQRVSCHIVNIAHELTNPASGLACTAYRCQCRNRRPCRSSRWHQSNERHSGIRAGRIAG